MTPDDTVLAPPDPVDPDQVVSVRSARVDVRVSDATRLRRGVIFLIYRNRVFARKYFDEDDEVVTIRARHPIGPWWCVKRFYRNPDRVEER